MSDFAALADEKFVCLTTFRKNGQAVPTPMWLVARDGLIYMRTDSKSFKARRIANNSKVFLAPSDFRGRPKGPHMEGQARLVPLAEAAWVQDAILAKYGWMKRLVDLRNRLIG